jgi:hypothetical protein
MATTKVIEIPRQPPSGHPDIDSLKLKFVSGRPLRRCSQLTKRNSVCAICGTLIRPGHWFRDAGLRCRAHDLCVGNLLHGVPYR